MEGKNPYYSIVELTEQFDKLSNEDLKKIDTRVISKILLAVAQQLAVISGRLEDIQGELEKIAGIKDWENGKNPTRLDSKKEKAK